MICLKIVKYVNGTIDSDDAHCSSTQIQNFEQNSVFKTDHL